VPVGLLPAVLGVNRHRHDCLAHDPVLPGLAEPVVGTDRLGVGVGLGDLREAVVQVLGRLAHRRGRRVDQALGDEARVVVDVLEHRMASHVLDSTRQDHVRGAHGDLAGAGCDRRQRTGAHAVDREAGNGSRQAREQGHVTSERQTLVSDLRGRGEDDVVDLFQRQGFVAAEQLADALDRHVVGAGLPEDALRTGSTEGAANTVDEVDLAKLAHAPRLVARSILGAPPSLTCADDVDRLDAGRRLAVPDQRAGAETDWQAHVDREDARYADGESRLGDAESDADARQRQLTRLGNASAGAGLALLMAGRRDEAAKRLVRAAERYRESFAEAPPGSWGRPIGAMKARILADDWEGAAADARWALEAGAAAADSPIGRYAAALACLVLVDNEQARVHADAIRVRDD